MRDTGMTDGELREAARTCDGPRFGAAVLRALEERDAARAEARETAARLRSANLLNEKLTAERDELRRQNLALAERCAGQSELLARRAEVTA